MRTITINRTKIIREINMNNYTDRNIRKKNMKINLNNKTIIKEIIMIKDMDINTKKKYRSHRQRTGQVTHMITNRKIKKK